VDFIAGVVFEAEETGGNGPEGLEKPRSIVTGWAQKQGVGMFEVQEEERFGAQGQKGFGAGAVLE
jgi:hypothetical protein